MKSKAGKIAAGLIASFLVIAIAVSMIPFNSSAGFVEKPTVTSKIKDYDAMSMKQILALDESLTYVFAGDSITHNTSYTQGKNGYAEWFEQYLYDIGRNQDAVINTAWGGADIADFQIPENEEGTNGTKQDPGQGLENFITKYNPDVVFIKLGMNDRDQTTVDFIRRYQNMLIGVYESGLANNKIPKVIVITPTPVSSENVYDDEYHTNPEEKAMDTTLRIRNSLESIVEEANLGGYNMLFTDFRTAFLNEAVALGADYHSTFYTSSSEGALHTNAAGQYFMFKTLMESLDLADEEMPIFQLTYEDMTYAALYEGDSVAGKVSASGTDWSSTLTENAVWIVAGAEQMSGYEGPVVNRSIVRLFDNALRGKDGTTSFRDIRIVNAAAPGNTPAYLEENFDAVIGEHITAATSAGNDSVFMLLPEVPEVYADGYDDETHATQLTSYEAAVRSLLGKSAATVEILWTPLASGDATANAYLADYADVIREIAEENEAVLLFDAYAVMNEIMAADTSVARNWFDNNGYISPLGAVDITYAFVVEMNNSYINTGELTSHNLRESSDNRIIKGNYVRDYYDVPATVSGTKVTLDVSAIVNAGYTLDTSSIALLPEVGTGNYHEDIIKLEEVTSDLAYADKKFTFTAPCSDLVLAIYSEEDGSIYRFKDVELTVDTDATIVLKEAAPTSATLGTLEIVGVPAVDLTAGDTQDVTLYQYQRYVQICATAQAGLKITVTYTGKDGSEVNEVVGSGKLSSLIPVDTMATVKVTVSGTVNDSEAAKTYTLNLTRPDYPDIIITEVMQDGYWGYDASNFDNYELVEIYNASGRDLNLLDYSIGFKKDYSYTTLANSKGEWPYYFTGNNQAFHSTTSGSATFTGINQITKYSSYWINDGTVTEPTEVIFKADSTMVIWLKEKSADINFDTLRRALEENAFAESQKTLTVDIDGTETAVVPTEEQLVVAEVPEGTTPTGVKSRVSTTADKVEQTFYLENFGSPTTGATTRGWLFILGNDAATASNGAITEAGNDIISASKFYRIAGSVAPNKLSSVFSYDVERAMSIVKDELTWDDKYDVGHTSDEQGYNNLTSFGAIEYWQKPADLKDTANPVIESQGVLYNVDTDCAAVNISITDDNDIRYIELNVRKGTDGEVTTIKKDLVLEAGVVNGGVTTDIKTYDYTYSFAEAEETDTVSYWGFVEDGNGNITEFGDENAAVDVCKKQVKAYTADEVKAFRANGTYPTLDGCLFAGWYTSENIPEDVDEALKVVLGTAEPTGTCYALFVPEHVLSVKAQITTNLTDSNLTNDGNASIRFVTTVDSLLYSQVGFKITYENANGLQSGTKISNEVYTELYAREADGSFSEEEGEKVVLTEYTPSGEFCTGVSNYFRTCTVKNVPASYYGTEFTVTPFWVTFDGAVVEGVTGVKSIDQGLPKEIVYVSMTDEDARDEAGYGTYEYPYETLSYALSRVKTGGKIIVKGNYTVDADFTWKAHNKSVTISGDATLDFSAMSELRIRDAVTFSSISLKLPTTVYAEGYDLTIAIDASVENTDTTIYGGSKKLAVKETNIALYTGTYASIYGGGNATNVTGDTHVTIAGNVNSGVDYEDHDIHNDVFGGSYNGTVYGDTYVTVGTEDTTDVDNAIACIVYGGGYGSKSVVSGTTHVNFVAGELMGIYGGSKQGVNADTQVVMTGGYAEQIFGGSYGIAMTGNTDVRVLGGEVSRRIYGGCYNDLNESTNVWASDYYVTGYTSVTIDDAANVSLDYEKTVSYGSLNYDIEVDNSLYAVSRLQNGVEPTDEIGVFIFSDYANDDDINNIGYHEDLRLAAYVSSGWADYFSTKTHNYLVKAYPHGDVYSVGNMLHIVPDNGYVAVVEIDDEQVHYAKGETRYVLPETDKTIVVKFSTDEQSTENYEAKIDGGYFKTIEDAFANVTKYYAPTIEILKDTVDVSSTLTVADAENVIVKEAEGVNATVYRADELANGSIFNVAAGGTLTIEGIILDGRTSDDITNEVADLDTLTGSTASLINVSGEVRLNDVTAQYAVKTSGYGAVVYGEGVATAKVTVADSEFNHNKSADQGGAICMYKGSSALEIKNSSFDDNHSDKDGGAVSAHASVATLENNTFVNNVSGNRGGGFYSGSNCVATMSSDGSEGVIFQNNTAAVGGGAIGIGSGSNTISGYTFKSNTNSPYGGAIYNSASTVTTINCIFESNSASSQGGAIYTTGSASTTTAVNCTFGGTADDGTTLGNTATGNGGAIYVASSGTLNLKADETNAQTEALFEANTSEGNGGAICVGSGTLNVHNYTFHNNSAKNGGAVNLNDYIVNAYFYESVFTLNEATSGSGGAINNQNKSQTAYEMYIEDCKFGGTAEDGSSLGNKASTTGGAVYHAGAASLTMKNTGTSDVEAKFEYNYAKTTGGALSTGGGTAEIIGYTFVKNESVGNGGAIHLSATTLNAKDCTFGGEDETYANHAGNHAGVIYAQSTSPIILTGTDENKAIIQNNYAEIDGGAIYIGTGTLTINGYSFVGNHADNGGAIRHNNQSKAKIENSKFSDNYSEVNGGAIYSRASTMDIDETDFTGNYTVDGHGGAIYQEINKVTIDSANKTAVFSGNKAQGTDKAGGAIYVAAGTLTGAGYKFIGNTATTGGAIFAYTGTVNVTECSFTDNTATNGGAIGVGEEVVTETPVVDEETGEETDETTSSTDYYSGKATIKNCDFSGNTASTNGGACYILAESTVSVTDGSTFTKNVATSGSGGAIYTANVVTTEGTYGLTVENCTFGEEDDTDYSEANTATKNGSAYGGAIMIVNGNAEIKNSNFYYNKAGNGGAIGASSANIITITGDTTSTFKGNCTITTGTYGRQGGAIRFNNITSATITGYRFDSNSATGNGGAIEIEHNSYVEVKDTVFTRNSSSANGGAILTWSEISVSGCTFGGENTDTETLGNTALAGGAIYTAEDMTVTDTDFIGNTATRNASNYGGGAVFSNSAKTFIFNSCDFIGNHAVKWGGACCFLADGYTANFIGDTTTKSKFESNTTNDVSGALVLNANTSYTATVNISNYEFTGNDSTKYKDSQKTIWTYYATNLTLTSCAFTDQTEKQVFDNDAYAAKRYTLVDTTFYSDEQ